jgi:hypothetical protein
MAQKFTENSHLRTKVRIRLDLIDELGLNNLSVLDAFAGQGLVWKEIQRQRPDLQIATVGIEKRKYINPNVIMGDNRKAMKGMDLAAFDIIDLDAFGCPWEQLTLCAEQAPFVPVVLTHISIDLGPVPKGLLRASGVPEAWYTSMGVPQALFGRWRWYWWENFVASLGYTESDSELHLDKSAVKLYEVLRRTEGA